MEQIKCIYDEEFTNKCLELGFRVNNRNINEWRNIVIHRNIDENEDNLCASSIAKIGETTILCKIKYTADVKNESNITFNVDLKSMSKENSDLHSKDTESLLLQFLLSHLVFTDKCSLHIDFVCINDDGSKIDVCLLSLNAALQEAHRKLRSLSTDAVPNLLDHAPLAASYVQSRTHNLLLVDPDHEEENSHPNNAHLTIIFSPKTERTLYMKKIGRSQISVDQLKQLLEDSHFKRMQYLKTKLDSGFKK
ncbi:hypothetical protein GJ496_011968 [Pomphorhynchus laevis]|nr:hypothetical protein GJ496_011968 [Pomphorhynchus laevis]